MHACICECADIGISKCEHHSSTAAWAVSVHGIRVMDSELISTHFRTCCRLPLRTRPGMLLDARSCILLYHSSMVS